MRVICAATQACKRSRTYRIPLGTISADWEADWLLQGGLAPRLEDLSSNCCSATVRCGTGGSDALRRYEAAGGVRAARPERREQTWKPELPTFLPRSLDGDAACLSSGTGRDDVSINTFIYLIIYFYSQDLEGCGCRWLRVEGRWRWRMHDVT